MAGCFSKVLIVHEDGSWRKRVSSSLSRRGFACGSADAWRDCVGTATTSAVECVVLPLREGLEHVGLTTISDVRRHLPECKVLALTPQGDTAAIRAAKAIGPLDIDTATITVASPWTCSSI